eukprot:9521342-Heterocapsa_arctica.AAC.1
MTDDIKGETTGAIGVWRNSSFWMQADIEQGIEHIAYFLETRLMQRRRLSKFGAVRLSRIEAMNIIRMKKKAFNFFATVA